MLAKETIKYLRSLKNKKTRKSQNKFIIEGMRIINEAIKSMTNHNGEIQINSNDNFIIEKIWVTKDFLKGNNRKFIDKIKTVLHIDTISETDAKRISNVTTSSGIIALVKHKINTNPLLSGPILLLDDISNPGNLGTIFRAAEWFGINTIYMSENTVDPFNPKVIQSSVGAHFHINSIIQTNLIDVIKTYKKINYTIISTSLDGTDFNKIKVDDKWILVLGNEAYGVSNEINRYVDNVITINKFGNIESLNVAMAGSIILSQLAN